MTFELDNNKIEYFLKKRELMTWCLFSWMGSFALCTGKSRWSKFKGQQQKQNA